MEFPGGRCKAALWRVVAGLVLFSASFGYVEAAVVIYLRSIYNPLRAHVYPATYGDLFPLLTVQQLQALGPDHIVRLKTELGRELATLLMLAGAALAVARKAREWVAAFLVCFGVWDVTFYVFLKLLVGWPASLLTWDILFLVPVPWTGPVLAPLVVSCSMIGCGLVLLSREYNNPVHLTWRQWSLITIGGVLIVAAFMWDFRNTANGGNPNPFNWFLFIAGEAIGVGTFVSSLRHASRPT
ncbi:MAG: hypothetical protein JO270_26040 [Acidobacteriaceae bacterium]|nr:hypothetical protein [Acidobacteriaceae bacterium]